MISTPLSALPTYFSAAVWMHLAHCRAAEPSALAGPGGCPPPPAFCYLCSLWKPHPLHSGEEELHRIHLAFLQPLLFRCVRSKSSPVASFSSHSVLSGPGSVPCLWVTGPGQGSSREAPASKLRSRPARGMMGVGPGGEGQRELPASAI